MISYRYDARSRDNPRFWHFSAGDADAGVLARCCRRRENAGAALSPGLGCFGLPLAAFHVPRQQRLKLMPFGSPETIRSRYPVSEANGSTPFNFADCTSVAMIAQWRPPVVVSGEEQSACEVIVTGLMARSTVLSIELQSAIFEEPNQSVPVVQRVTDCLGQGGSTWDTAELFVEPDMHGLDERPALISWRTR